MPDLGHSDCMNGVKKNLDFRDSWWKATFEPYIPIFDFHRTVMGAAKSTPRNIGGSYQGTESAREVLTRRAVAATRNPVIRVEGSPNIKKPIFTDYNRWGLKQASRGDVDGNPYYISTHVDLLLFKPSNGWNVEDFYCQYNSGKGCISCCDILIHHFKLLIFSFVGVGVVLGSTGQSQFARRVPRRSNNQISSRQ